MKWKSISWFIFSTFIPLLFTMLLISSFLSLIIFSVPMNLWSFGLLDGNLSTNEREKIETKTYKMNYYALAEKSTKRVDEMKDVSFPYRLELKQFVLPNVPLALGVARILSSRDGMAASILEPKPELLLEPLLPRYYYKTFSKDYLERKHLVKESHTILHPFVQPSIRKETKRVTPHQELKRIDLSNGSLHFTHHVITSPWVTVSKYTRTSGHRVNGKWCKITKEIEIQERTHISRVNDKLWPIFKQDDLKEEAILYGLGLKSKRDIQLAYLIAQAERGERVGHDPTTPEPCLYCYWNPGHAQGEWIWPVAGHSYVSSPYGPRWGSFHHGIDIPAPLHTSILATHYGLVTYVGPSNGYGNVILIQHENQMQSRYGHMKQMYVQVGDEVNAGDVIAGVGNEGRSTGPHLHFEVRVGVTLNNQFSKNTLSIDPLSLFNNKSR
jgi:hypothetical protein